MRESQDPTADYLEQCRGESAAARRLRGCVGSAQIENADPGWAESLLPRPMFRSAEVSAALSSDLATLTDAVATAIARRDKLRFLEELGASSEELELTSAGMVGTVAQFMRADVLYEAGRPKVVELNNDCLGGIGVAKINAAVMQNPEFSAFAHKHGLSHVDTREAIMQRLLAAVPGFHDGMRPTVAVVEERNSGLGAKFTAVDLAATGRIDVLHCEIDQLAVRSGGTFCGEKRVDVVFRYFTAGTMAAEDVKIVRQLTEESLAGRLGLVTSLDSELVNRKTLFGWLWRPDVLAEFAPDVRDIIERLLPWTLSSVPAVTQGRPLTAAELEQCVDEQQEMVLKPAEGSQSKGVLYGHQLTRQDWVAQVTRTDTAFVVQRRVRPDIEVIHDPESGSPVEWNMNYGLFQFGGRNGGTFVRARRADNEGPIGEPGTGTRLGCAFEF